MNDEYEWDLFISHASEDKESFVRELARKLQSFGVRVWYDEFSLELGDSLSRSIDKGLAFSKYGLVVLSEAFITKPWTEYELRGLTAREIHEGKRILPIWHNISKEEVLKFSPPLADKFAFKAQDQNSTNLALKIISVVRPDIIKKVNAHLAWKKLIASSKSKTVSPSELTMAPIQHENLPDRLINRIKVIQSSLSTVYPLSLEEWIDNFRRDIKPEDEIEIWEKLLAWYLKFQNTTGVVDVNILKAAFKIMLSTILNLDASIAIKEFLNAYKINLLDFLE